MTEKPLETIGDVNAALKHLGWETVDDVHYWAISNDIERFEQLVQAFARHRTASTAALEEENAAHVRNTLDHYRLVDELTAERDALVARIQDAEEIWALEAIFRQVEIRPHTGHGPGPRVTQEQRRRENEAWEKVQAARKAYLAKYQQENPT